MAIIGSRGLIVEDISVFLPDTIAEIVSGGAIGIDSCARAYAKAHGIKLTEFLPEYGKYGKYAPLKRNIQIIEYADEVIAIWDGASRGTKFVIDKCGEMGVPIKVYTLNSKK